MDLLKNKTMDIMNKLSERLIVAILIIATITAFGIAATEDYNQTVIESIPDEAYQEIIMKLGSDCGNSAIVTEYETNKDYYNSKKY